eukprot:GHVR01026896.1.p1 GENE.GHVR01026896.1~~GHVR01026896.1.p1  ORF type:complete len:126 (-),score=9.72 GHVR01026896.1:968-1345(-)
MLENGEREFLMETVKPISKMVHSLIVILVMGKQIVKMQFISFLMVLFIEEMFLIRKFKAVEPLLVVMVWPTMGNGQKINHMAKEKNNFLMEILIRANIDTGSKMEMESLFGRMEKSIQGSFKMDI